MCSLTDTPNTQHPTNVLFDTRPVQSGLNLFVLALINSGVSTPYTLQKEPGLPPGAAIPAIQRLLQAGLIRQGRRNSGDGQSIESL